MDLQNAQLRVPYQLDRKGKRVRLKTAAARRDVIVIDALGSALRRHRLASSFSTVDDPVFATSSGSAMSTRNATRALARTAKRAGLDDVTAHALRHTFASMLIERGRDPVFVADQLGHTNPAITLRVYAHLFRAAKQADDARDQLQAAYGRLLR